MSSTMRSICCDEVYAVRTSSAWSGARRACISRSSIGTMPLSGVRISWLMVARNSPLAITADSAACLAWRIWVSSWVCCSICACSCSITASSRRARSSASSISWSRRRTLTWMAMTANSTSNTSTRVACCQGPMKPRASSTRESAAPAAAPSASQRNMIAGGRPRVSISEHRVVEVEVHFSRGLLHQVALDEVDPAHPERGRGLRILHLLADDAQAQAVRALDGLAHFIAHRRIVELLRVARTQPHVAQRQLREQGVGFAAGLVLAEAQLHPGGHHGIAELAQRQGVD